MRYESTRGKSGPVSPAEALLNGAAGDSGLYMPDTMPDLSHLLTGEYDYAGLAGQVFAALLPGFSDGELDTVARAAYGAQFDSPGIVPLVVRERDKGRTGRRFSRGFHFHGSSGA